MAEENSAEQAENRSDHGQEDQARQEAAPSEIDLLRKTLEEAQSNAASLKDQLLRKAAEFENYKRRTEADFVNLIKTANETLLVSLIPILNDFVRSLKHGSEIKDYEAFYKGVELIYNKLSKALEAQGLVPFESTGKPFDVDYHDALLQIPRDDVPPHTVVEEVEQGYKLNNKVIRHAKVIVSSAPETTTKPERITDNMKADKE
jgi:molecular chaperone GrpE